MFNGLDESYRRLSDPFYGGPFAEAPRPPRHPSRVRAFVLACGLVAYEDDAAFAGAKMSKRAVGA